MRLRSVFLSVALITSLSASAQTPAAPSPAAPAQAEPPKAPDVKPAKPPKAPKKTPELLEKGKQQFVTLCAACHGEKGDGTGPAAVALDPKPRDFTKEGLKQGSRVEDLFATLTTGVPGSSMVAFAHLSEEDRWAVSYFVYDLLAPKHRNKKPPPPPKDAPVAPGAR